MQESWKPVVGFESYYSVSDHGRIRREVAGPNTCIGKILNPCKDSSGYYGMQLFPGSVWVAVHKVVAEAFIGREKAGLKLIIKTEIKPTIKKKTWSI